MNSLDGRFFIAGNRIETKEKVKVENPATLEPIGEACLASPADCKKAVEAAKEAFPLWRALPHREKQKIFLAAKDILLRRAGDVARLITVEKGTPLPESLAVEVLTSLEALDYYGHNQRKTLAPKKVKAHMPLFAHKKNAFIFQPLGPVLPVMAFSDVDEAIALANDSPYGLTASVWTRDKKMASWVAEQLEVGSVTVNDHMFSFTEPKAIWGGIKQTGMGRTHGPYGLLEISNIKFVSADFAKKRERLWWFPYAPVKQQVLEKSLILLHGRRFKQKLKALFSLLPRMKMVRAGTPFRSLLKITSRLFKK